jgi:hypothetical protein
MAFSPELQAQIDSQLAVEAVRQANQMEMVAKQAKLEGLRIAQVTLLENSRSKPVNERDITAEDIIAFANTLAASVNS